MDKNSATKAPAKKKSVSKKAPAKKAAPKKRVTNTKAEVSAAPAEIKKPASTENTIVLDSVLVINEAKKLYGELGKYINGKTDITIDASSVEMVDTAILQLLLAFVLKIKSKGIKVIWSNPSKDMVSKAETLNMAAQMGLVEAGG